MMYLHKFHSLLDLLHLLGLRTGAATTIAHALNQHVSSVPQRREGEHVAVSPLRMTTIRRSCLQDLKMLKELLEDGVLTEIEFTEEKQNILATLKDLKK